MIIYVDVLVCLNLVIDYLLLSITEKLVRYKVRFWRKLLAATVSALFSLYIFLPPQPIVIEIIMRLVSSFAAVFICFGFNNARVFFRRCFTFFTVSFVYAGVMAGVWMMLKPDKMSVNNGIVYFDISPIWLITASVVIYAVIVIAKKLTAKQAENAENCVVTVFFNGNEVSSKAIVDTGHSLNDAFSDSVVIVIEKSVAALLFGAEDTALMLEHDLPQSDEVLKRFRLIPVNTVSGEKILPAVRVDKAEVVHCGKTFKIIKPIAVIAATSIDDECKIIIPPEALNY